MDKIYLMADLHGDWKCIRNFHQRHNTNQEYNEADKTMIILGDAGILFFENKRDEELKKHLGKFPFTFFIIRGNHDLRASEQAMKHPTEWHLEPFWGSYVYVENDYPYIKYAMDYVNIYHIPYNGEHYKTLIVPGGYSVDKYYRVMMGWTWNPTEQLSAQEMEMGKDLIKEMNYECDLILSHTCPIAFEPTDLFIFNLDQSTVDKTMERYLGEIEYQMNYKAILWGHYHAVREYPRQIGVPTYQNPRQLMLYNTSAVDLYDVMNEKMKVKEL
jgi:3-oxoacid CoA-transferase subunit A